MGAGNSGLLLTGRDSVRGLFASTTRLYPDGTSCTRHVTINLIGAGRYHDRFERHSAAWRSSERRYFVDLVGDVSHHMITGLPT